MTPIKLLIDTDPGVDDAVALLLALSSPDVEVVGLTTIFGNIDVETATRNALSLLELAGRPGVPVARGAPGPLDGRPPPYARDVHGDNGLGDILIPPPLLQPSRLTAAELIVRQVRARPGELTLVALGPLTNLALALRRYPRLAMEVAGVVVMGGAFHVPGNITPAAEANVFNDPLAAASVLNAGWPVTLVGLDVTTRVVMTPEYIESLRQPGNILGELIWRVSRVYESFHLRRYGLLGLYAHDPAAIACALEPSLFTTQDAQVHVTLGGVDAGRTSMLLPSGSPGPVRVCLGVDAAQVLELIRSRLTLP